MNTRRREAPGRRKKPSREPHKRILAVCEGKVTEPDYLQELKIHLRNPALEIEFEKAAGVSKTLVDKAVELKKRSDRDRRKRPDDAFDEVWAVFDRDEHPNFIQSCKKAIDNGVLLAVSNPCFELWLLLHFQDQTAPIDRKDARRQLCKHDPTYDKHVTFSYYTLGIDDACRRARDLDDRAQEFQTDGNPTTQIYKLVASVRI